MKKYKYLPIISSIVTTGNHSPNRALVISWQQKHIKWEIRWTVCNENYLESELELSCKAATKLKHELSTNMKMQNVPFMELSSLAEDIHTKAQEVLQNSNLDMRELLGTDKYLQSIQGQLVNSNWKSTELKKDDPTFLEEQKHHIEIGLKTWRVSLKHGLKYHYKNGKDKDT